MDAYFIKTNGNIQFYTLFYNCYIIGLYMTSTVRLGKDSKHNQNVYSCGYDLKV